MKFTLPYAAMASLAAHMLFADGVSAQTPVPSSKPDNEATQQREIDKLRAALYAAKPDPHPMARLLEPGDDTASVLSFRHVVKNYEDDMASVADIVAQAKEENKLFLSFEEQKQTYIVPIGSLHRMDERFQNSHAAHDIVPFEENVMRLSGEQEFVMGSASSTSQANSIFSTHMMAWFSQPSLEIMLEHEIGHARQKEPMGTVDANAPMRDEKIVDVKISNEYWADSAMQVHSSQKEVEQTFFSLAGYMNAQVEKAPDAVARQRAAYERDTEFSMNYLHRGPSHHPSTLRRILYSRALDEHGENKTTMFARPAPYRIKPDLDTTP